MTAVRTGEATGSGTGAPEPKRPALRLVRPLDPDPPGGAAEPQGHAVDSRHVQGTLALLFTLPGGLPATPAPVPALHAVLDDDPGPVEGPLPDPRRWVARLVQATVEVREGDRPSGQLLRWMTREVHDRVCRDVASRTRPMRARRRPQRAVLRSLRVTAPAPGTVEACAVVDAGARARAVAVRLEARDGRWMCTALDVL